MDLIQFQNETSERSDAKNWVKAEISASPKYYFAGFEGCNENSSNVVTVLLDRAAITISGNPDILPSDSIVFQQIKEKERGALKGKINFCSLLGLPYTYILYNYDYRFVLRYEVKNDCCVFKERYSSFESFSQWIRQIKGWDSTKKYEEIDDLPLFDKELRKAGCAWPTNIDCIAYSRNDIPVALIEFQNSKFAKVQSHFNNEYFLSHLDRKGKKINQGADEQRWRSQEILRLQSGLPHLTIVWSQNEDIAVIKILDGITFPEYPKSNEKTRAYSDYLTSYSSSLKKKPRFWRNKEYEIIRQQYASYRLEFLSDSMKKIVFQAPLSLDDKTFPFLYGRRILVTQKGNSKDSLESVLLSCSQNGQ